MYSLRTCVIFNIQTHDKSTNYDLELRSTDFGVNTGKLC